MLAFLNNLCRRLYTTCAGVFNQVEERLEKLSTIGSVTVVRNDVAWPLYGFEYVIEFQPWEHDDLSHYLNYGDMPSISVRNARPRHARRDHMHCSLIDLAEYPSAVKYVF